MDDNEVENSLRTDLELDFRNKGIEKILDESVINNSSNDLPSADIYETLSKSDTKSNFWDKVKGFVRPTLVVGVISGLAYLTHREFVTPQYMCYYKTHSNDYSVCFSDNNALGMKGYANYEDTLIELKRLSGDPDSQDFLIPKDFLNKDFKFKVFAIDKDGHKSWSKKLYSYHGYVSDRKLR